MHTEIFIFSMSNFLYFTITTYITLWGSTKYPLSFKKNRQRRGETDEMGQEASSHHIRFLTNF